MSLFNGEIKFLDKANLKALTILKDDTIFGIKPG